MILTSRPRSRPWPAVRSGRAAVGAPSATRLAGHMLTTRTTTMSMHNYAVDDDEEETTETGDESVSYVEISSVDHPQAYQLIKGRGPIRSNVDVNDFYAELTQAVAPFFTEGSSQQFLDFALVLPDGSVDEEALARFCKRHGVMGAGDSDDE